MARVLVCGASIFDDPEFVHKSLCEVDRDYGPITCIIHNHHSQAQAWQQWAAQRRPVRYVLVTEDYARDGVMAGERCRDRMFAARPDLVVAFDVAVGEKEERQLPTERRSKMAMIMSRAAESEIPAVFYMFTPRRDRRQFKARKPSLQAAAGERTLHQHRRSAPLKAP
jgi:hypothetical protein